MNKFYLQQIILKEEGENVKNVTEFENRNAAEAFMRHEFAYNMILEGNSFIRYTVINEQGNQEPGLNEVWQKKVPEPEPVENTEPVKEEEPVVEPVLYFMTHLKTSASGTVDANLFEYPDLDSARYAYNDTISDDINDSTCSELMVLVEDQKRSEYYRRYWKRS